jgi:Glycosyl hydrolases family 2/Glycosyl hydrolases family 2, sugar binding domain/Glycosyl hydrolases family 2, TIM barrel domain
MNPHSSLHSRRFGLLAAPVLSLISTIPTAAWQLLQAPVMSPWAQLVDPASPLPEYPRPQMTRSRWLNLNGIWEFKAGSVGEPVPTNQTLPGDILVPFPMESVISGVAVQHPRSWYRRQFVVPPAWSGQKILLHLEAVDWESEVFIDGVSCGIHRGGYDKMTYDITSKVTTAGPHEMIVRVYDPTDLGGYPRGKQTLDKALNDVVYTSCTGIWQTVWLEPVPQTSVEDLKLVPDIDNGRLNVTVTLAGPTVGMTVTAVAKEGATVVGTVTGAPNATLQLNVPTPKLWSPSSPFLYDLEVTVSNGATQLDTVRSYFGMRKISIGMSNGFVKMLLNNQFTFQYGPLDQGYWPDGIYTAPTDDALKSDIEQAKILGCNMIRKHLKVESARWYYWTDKLGMLVWQDMPSCNSYNSAQQTINTAQFKAELTRMVDSRRNHPSLVSWVIFNEGQGQHDTVALTDFVSERDPSRLVNQASGWTDFGGGDVLDNHHYTDPVSPASATRAVVCGEYGGVGLPVMNHIWGSGFEYTTVADSNALASKFEDMSLQLSDLARNSGLSAAVYTQITDVESELNGLLTYDRQVRKPDADRIRASVAQASCMITIPALVPSSQTVGQSWKYTTTTPASNWYASDFTDTAWSSGLGGFGGFGGRRTLWNTSDIWLRRTFNPGTLTASQLPNLRFSVFHDEGAEIYINGVLAATIGGYNTNYALFPLTTAGQNAILSNANNVLAVHCRQTTGGQYIDVGLSLLQGGVVLPPRPLPTRPTTLLVKNGKSGPSLGWAAVPNATTYQIKRSLTSGGPYTNLLLSSPINAVIDTAVANGTTYHYVISAINATGESENSAQVAVTVVFPPPPPGP